jgi:hypothetical protein
MAKVEIITSINYLLSRAEAKDGQAVLELIAETLTKATGEMA